jgi:hypothetical protein
LSGATSVKRSSTSAHWSTARPASSAVATIARDSSGTPQTSVMSAPRPPSPRQRPTTSSQTSIRQSGLRSAVSSVKSASAVKSDGSAAAPSPSGSPGTNET